jgi:CBS domain-containing protein
MTIARLLEGRNFPILTCCTDDSVRDAVALLASKRIGAMPVLAGGTVAGIFSERDALYQLHRNGPEMLDLLVGDVMTQPVVTVTAQTEVLEALGQMTMRRIRHFPVMEGGEMIGFVSIGDLVKYRIERIEAEAEAMRAYIQAA